MVFYISLKTNDAEHLFLCVLKEFIFITSYSSLLPIVKLGCVSFITSLQTFQIYSGHIYLLEVCSTNLTLGFAFLLPLKMSFSEQKILMKLKIIHLFFHYVTFMSCLKSLCLSHEDILLQKPYFEIPVGYLVNPAPTTEMINLHLWPSKGTSVINHLLSIFDPLFCFTDLSLM